MVPPGTIPFDGLSIHAKTLETKELLRILQESFDDGDISQDELSHRLDDLLQQGEIRIDKNMAEPYSRGKFNAQSKKKWYQKNRSNPLSGKGKSYGKHVEDGWGQYVKPTRGDPNDGKW